MVNPDGTYSINAHVLVVWLERAKAVGGCRTEVVRRVAEDVIAVCVNSPKSIISGVPIRVRTKYIPPGMDAYPRAAIYWTARIDHPTRHIEIVHIEPEPHPGL